MKLKLNKLNDFKIVNKASRAVNGLGLKAKKHSPEILAVVGTAGVGFGVYKACKATLKVNEIVEDAKTDIEKIHAATDAGVTAAGKTYTEEDSKRDLTIVYTQTGIKMVKLYAPSVAIVGLSVGALLTSNHILRKRNIALAAAYTTLEKSYKNYRSRVVERFGEELDRELFFNIKAKEVEEIEVNEKGKEKIVKKTVQVIDPEEIDEYARIFYEGNPGWDPNPTYTLKFLKDQQAYANKKLRAKKSVCLNEIYDMLGFSRIPEGQAIGWIYDANNEKGDNQIDFGIWDVTNESNIRFVNGDERGVLLNFNHEGYIIDRM